MGIQAPAEAKFSIIYAKSYAEDTKQAALFLPATNFSVNGVR